MKTLGGGLRCGKRPTPGREDVRCGLLDAHTGACSYVPTAQVPGPMPIDRDRKLTGPERAAIRAAVSAGEPRRAVADRLLVSYGHLKELCRGARWQRIKTASRSEIEEARARLGRAITPAIDAWETALPIAATKGDHRPARDLLVSMKVIEAAPKLAVAQGVTVFVGSPTHGVEPPPIAVFDALRVTARAGPPPA